MNVNPLRARPRDEAQTRAFPSRLLPSSRRHRRRATAARSLLACAVAATAALSARATEYWVGADGNWADLMWSATPGGPPGQPPPNDNALIVFNDALTRTVTFVGTPATLQSVQLDNTGGGNSVLAQTQGAMNVVSLVAGVAGRGEYDLSAGTLNALNSFNVNALGAFNQSGGQSSFGNLYVSSARPNAFTLSGGTMTVNNLTQFTNAAGVQLGGTANIAGLTLGGSNGSSYALSGGSLTSSGALRVGAGSPAGTSTFTQSAAATASIASIVVGDATSSGSFTMQDGAVLTVPTTPIPNGQITVNQGSFNQAGGSVTARGITVGGTSASAGPASYSLGDGATLKLTSSIVIGATGTASFTQSGGSVTAGGFTVGQRGTFTMNAGTQTAATNSAVQGGTLNLGGGSIAVTNALTLTNATVNQSGGSLTAKTLTVNGTNGGTYTMTGGSLAATVGSSVIDAGSFVQSGGTVTLGSLTLASNTFNAGTQASSYSIGPGATLVVNQALNVGGPTTTNNASITQTGGSVQAGSLTIGNSSGRPASYSMGGGTLGVAGDILLDSGSYAQTGGAVVANRFSRDLSANGGIANITLGGGSILATGTTTTTALFATTVNHTGGSLHIGSSLSLGDSSSQPPNTFYNLSDTGALTVDGNVLAGDAVFTQNGGSTSVGGYFDARYAASVSVSGGTFTVAGPIQLGFSGLSQNSPTTFTQSGGDVRAAYVAVGQANGGYTVASYNLSGGTLTATNGTSLVVSVDMPCSFTQSGGTFTASALQIYGYSAADQKNNSYALNGGVLNVTGDLTAGPPTFGSGAYLQTGGVATIGGTLRTSAGSGGNGPPAAITLSGGSLTAGQLANNGAFAQTGGSAAFGAVSGTGSLSVANGTTTVTSFAQNAVTVGDGGRLQVLQAPTVATNTASSLTITGSGTLDLSNHHLLVNTSDSIRTYVAHAAGAPQPNGLNPWTGPGLTSSLVQADAANGNAKQLALGYFDSRDNADTGLNLPAGQTLVRTTVYGDATGDGKVSIADLSAWNNNFGAPSARWSQGDFNYDGKVNIADLSIWNNNFGANVANAGVGPTARTAAAAVTAAATLTSSASASPAAVAAGTLEMDVDRATGDVKIVGGGVTIAAIELDSASGALMADKRNPMFVQRNLSKWTVAGDTANQIGDYVGDATAQFGQPYTLAAGASVDWGNVLPANLGDLSGLTFSYNQVLDTTTGQTVTVPGVIVFTGVPEPTSLGLIGVAALGLRRRRRRYGA